MSNNYQGPLGFGYGQGTNTNQNSFNSSSGNSYQSFGYGNNSFDNRVPQNSNPLIRLNSLNISNDPYATRGPFDSSNQQYQSNFNPYPTLNSQHQNFSSQNNFNQEQKSTSMFSNLMQGGGGLKTQIQSSSPNQQGLQNGLNIWQEVCKVIDWDSFLKKKNVSKKQSDTSWVTYQEQSWLQPQPSRNIQIQTDRKFAFPNPYIKYKIIPGVNQTMALDVTAKNELQKGLVKGNLIIWDYHGGPNQQFYIHRCPKGGDQQVMSNNQNRIEDDEFILINAATGFVVSAINLSFGSQKKQNGLCVYPKMKDNPNQRWKLRPIKENSDIFTIQSVDTGNVIDCENGSRSNGTNIIQWKANSQKNQMWKILPA